MKRSIKYLTGFSFLCLVLLASCGEPVRQQGARHTQVKTRTPPQDFAPGLSEEALPANEAQLKNDPSALLATPLCGAVQKETHRLASQVYSDSLSSRSACPQNACFDPLTGTFIAASGARSVCR